MRADFRSAAGLPGAASITAPTAARRGRFAAGCRVAGVCLALGVSLLLPTSSSLAAAGQTQPPAADPLVEPEVRETLQKYASALESLDADAVKKVQPSIDVDGLKRAFGEMRSLDVDIENVKVLSGDRSSARVSCRVTQTLTPKAGSRQTSTVTRVLRLRRQDGLWVIQDFER
jgi:hypothetical protein